MTSDTTFTVTVTGADELKQALDGYPNFAASRIANAINKALAILQKSATDDVLQFKTPRTARTGLLQLEFGLPGRSLKLATTTDLSGRIWSNVKYAIYVHEGTAPYVIRVRTAKVLANSKTGQIFGREVHHPGTQPNRFMPRIIAKGQGEIDEQFALALQNIVDDLVQATRPIRVKYYERA